MMTKQSKYFEAVAAAVAGGQTVRQAAESIGCGESTSYRISCDPRFRRRVSELRTAASDAAAGALTVAAVDACRVLREISVDASAKPGDRIAASKAILTLLAPIAESGELRARIDALEAAQDQRLGVVAG